MADVMAELEALDINGEVVGGPVRVRFDLRDDLAIVAVGTIQITVPAGTTVYGYRIRRADGSTLERMLLHGSRSIADRPWDLVVDDLVMELPWRSC